MNEDDGKLKTPDSFIYMGFDHLMRNRKVFDKYKTLEDGYHFVAVSLIWENIVSWILMHYSGFLIFCQVRHKL